MEGMGYYRLKTELKGLYKVNATQLDDGEGGVPHCVYCVKSFFLHKGEWVAQDTVKIGKTSSIANRVRTYGQSGADVRILWNIDCVDPKFAKELEEAVHKEARPHHIQLTLATEMFDMDVTHAHSFLDGVVEKFELKNNNQVICINRYTPTEMQVYEVDTANARTVSINNMYGKLFQEI